MELLLGCSNSVMALVQGRFGGVYKWKLKIDLGNSCHNPDEKFELRLLKYCLRVDMMDIAAMRLQHLTMN